MMEQHRIDALSDALKGGAMTGKDVLERIVAEAGEPDDLRGITEQVRQEMAAARAAGVTSKSFPSERPIGSVLDDLSARPEKAKELGISRVRTLLAHAEHFLLDEAAGERIVDMVAKHAPLIAELQEFALRPFDRMTISLPTRAASDADRETLLLLDRREGINCFAMVLRNTGTGDIAAIPGWYTAKPARDGAFTLIRLDGSMPNDERMKYATGTYAMAIDAVMLFLNQKHGVQISEPTPRRRAMLRGRPCTFFARSTVHLSLDSPQELRHHYSSGTHASPRRHAVRGHFFHRGGDLACSHRWARLDDHEQAWECVDCERRRFWRRDFERGDAERGMIASRYHVAGSSDE